MKLLKTLFLLIFLFLNSLSFISQNLEKHVWQNRVILIFTEDKINQKLIDQTLILEEHQKELEERKLVIYRVTEGEYDFNFEENWQKTNSTLNNYVDNSKSFRIILIGLDGKKKLEQSAVLSSEKLFTIIDGMPMRKNEIKKGN